MDEAIVTVPAPAGPSVVIEKFWVDGNLPCGFDVSTRPEHGLDVVIEQRVYRKTYTGTGSRKSSVVPVAPVGTEGRIIVRDTMTGETIEQPWTWYLLRGGSGGLWALLKGPLWKGN